MIHSYASKPSTQPHHAPQRYKNYVDEPKKNGYQSLHMGVFLMEGGGTAEVQVRTARMHEEAESGGASHALYKAEILTPDKVAAFKSKQQRLPGSSSGPDPSSLQPEASSQEAVVVVSAGAGASAPEP